MTLYDKAKEHQAIIWSLAVVFGFAVRFAVMSVGYNIDFANYCVTGELAAAGKNVYASTKYYNYGPIWFMVLGIFYRTASFFQNNILVYRIMIVTLLTLIDLLMAGIIAKKAGSLWGIVFFLNPFSVFNDGYNNQFDNVAVCIGMLGMLCLEKSSREDNISFRDVCGIVLLSVSLITKHVLWAFPLWLLLNTSLTAKKRVIYALIPPAIFLLSFAPYLSEGWQGIFQNVFMYRAANNCPLLVLNILKHYGIFIPFLEKVCFPLFCVLMAAGAYIFRHEDIYRSFLLYTIAVTCASSAIFSHYFVIPVMGLLLLFREKALIYLALIVVIAIDRNLMHTVLVWTLVLYLINYCQRSNSDMSR